METAVTATTSVLGASVPSLLGDYSDTVAYLSQAIVSPAAVSVVCAACASALALYIRARRRRVALASPLIRDVVESAQNLVPQNLEELDEDQRCAHLFHQLPDEILLQILKHMDTSDLLSFTEVNHKWASMCNESIRSVALYHWSSYWADFDAKEQTSQFLKLFKRVAPNVTELLFCLKDVAPQATELIGAGRRIQYLSIDYGLTKRTSQAVAKLTQLQTLSLGCDTCPDTLRPIMAHPSITDLNMNEATLITSDAEAWRGIDIASLPLLQSFQCRYLRAPVLSINKLNQNMHTLHLPWANLADMQVSQFSHLTSLTSLDLSGFKCPDPFTFLTNMTRLTSLKLNSSLVTDAPLRAVAKMTNLHTLSLNSCTRLDGSFLSSITNAMPALRFLDLSHSTELEHGIEHLANCGQLESLNLSFCAKIPSDKASVALNSLGMLTLLNVESCTELDNQIIPSLERMSRLLTLNISACSRISTLPSRIPAMDLQVLQLGRTSISGDALACFSSVTSLRHLNLEALSDLHPNSLSHFCRNPLMSCLDISGTPISEESLLDVFNGPKINFRYVSVFSASGCSGVTDKVLQALFSLCPSISTLKLLNCSNLTAACGPSFASLSRVYDLKLGGPAAVDSTLAAIGKVKNLSGVSVVGNLITAQGIIDAFATSSASSISVAPLSAFSEQDRNHVRKTLSSISVSWREEIQ